MYQYESVSYTFISAQCSGIETIKTAVRRSHMLLDNPSAHCNPLQAQDPPHPIKRGGKEKERGKSDGESRIRWVCIHE